jgi:hypothetical protein
VRRGTGFFWFKEIIVNVKGPLFTIKPDIAFRMKITFKLYNDCILKILNNVINNMHYYFISTRPLTLIIRTSEEYTLKCKNTNENYMYKLNILNYYFTGLWKLSEDPDQLIMIPSFLK